jgi:hypothetical protein
VRVALLSMIDFAPGDGGLQLCGLLPFGGRSLARVQLDLALRLRCQRIICLAVGMPPGVIALQHLAERGGAEFHVIASRRNLPSLVHATDELIVLADGLLPLADEAAAILDHGHAVLALPVEAGLAAGFERIDLNHAWAGVLAMPGSLSERLFELPEDADIVSSLLRIALQARIAPSLLPNLTLAEARWAMVRSIGEARLHERTWLRRQALLADPLAPGRWLAGRLVAGYGPRLMQRGIHAVTLALVALLLACIACWAAVAQYVAAGLAVCAVAVFLLEVSLRLRRLEIGGQDRDRAVARLEALRWLLDAVLVALLAAGMAGSWPERLFPAAILLGLVNLLPLLSARRWIAPVEDRVSQSLILSIAAMAGYLLPALQLITLLLLGLSLIAARRRDRLTPA